MDAVAELNRGRRYTNGSRGTPLRHALDGAPLSIMLAGVEMTVLLTVLALYKKVGRPLGVFLPTPAGHAFLIGVVCLAIFSIGVLVMLRRSETRRQLPATIGLHAWLLALLFLAAEGTVRFRTHATPQGPAFGSIVLLPRSWAFESARNRAVLEKAAIHRTYLVPDSGLGWSINPSSRSADYNLKYEELYLAELRRAFPDDSAVQRERPNVSAGDDSVYLSSVEGMRSPRAGMSFANTPARHRIALVGDSFTFGLEVRYEQTWGHQLEQALGNDYHILNFGVDGFGVDQAFLRYRRDVVPWHPDLVILGLVSDDMYRSMCVYAFLCFKGSEMPFAKPRFVIDADSLRLLNTPVPRVDSLFTAQRISDLPLIQYDRSFDPLEWQRHPYDAVYAIRLLLSKYRHWSVLGPLVNDEALERVNGEILRAFVRTVQEHGSTPVIVFLPAKGELAPDWKEPFRGPAELRDLGISYIDATPCVTRLAPPDRFVVLHYSAAANREVARCVREGLERVGALRERGRGV